VVGAGLAWLSCARILRRAGYYVEMFEEDRIGGGLKSLLGPLAKVKMHPAGP
jgi:phytoene dehydrogenase-like protein